MIRKKEIINYYSGISKAYDQLRLSSSRSKMISCLQINWFITNVIEKNNVCLEVGCGIGRVTQNLLKKVKTLIATDASLEMMKINRKLISLYKPKEEIEYVLCDVSHLPFHIEYFDVVIGARIFWHISDYVKALKEAFRVVRPNGVLLFDFPCLFGPFSLLNRVRNKLSNINHDVLTLFIYRKTIEKIFKASTLDVFGNTSIILYFIPNKLLENKIVRKLICVLENFYHWCLKDILFSYYLVKVTKLRSLARPKGGI